MAPIEKRREVFTDLLKKRIADAKAKPIEKKQEERVIRKKLVARERAVVIAKARAREVVLSKFHKEYVKIPLKVIEREMGLIKDKIKYLEGQRKKVKTKGKVTLESNIRALNARLSVLGNIRREVLIKSTKSKVNNSTKIHFTHQPEPPAVERRRGEVVKGNQASPKPAKIGIENIQSPKEAISAINGLVDRVIITEQSSDMEATNKSLSQFSVGLEAKMNGVFRGFNEKRVSLDELNIYYTSIDSILRKAHSRPDKVIPLGRLELLRKRLEEILFPEGKDKVKAQVKDPEVPIREPEAVVASREKTAPEIENALAELKVMLRNVHVDVRLILEKLTELPERAQQTIIVDVVNLAVRTNNTTLLQAIDVSFGNRFEQVIKDQRKVFAGITELMTGFKGGFARDRQAIIAELQDLSRVVKEANTSEKIERVVERLSSLEKYFETDAFKKIITEVVKDANKTSNAVLLTEMRDRFTEIMRDMEGVTQAITKSVKDVRVSIEKDLRETTERLLQSLNAEGKANKEEIMSALEEINNLLLDKAQNDAAVLGEIKNELLELEKFFDKKAFEKYLQNILESAFANERPQLVDAILKEFENKYPDLKDLKARFDAVETLIQTAKTEITAEVKRQTYILYTWLKSIDTKVSQIGNKVDNIAQAIDKLSNFFEPTVFEKFLQDALLPEIRNAIEEGNKRLYDILARNIGNKYGKLSAGQKKLKELIINLSNREEQRYAKIKKLLEGLKDQSEENQREVLNRLWDVFTAVDKGNKISEESLEILKGLETFFKEDTYKDFLKTVLDENNVKLIEMMKSDPFFKDKIDKAYIDTKFEEITKLIKEEKEKKPEAKKEEGWWKKYGPPTAGMSFLLLLIALLAFLIIQALRNSGGGPSGGIPSTAVVPIIGETAQAASGGLSSILGPLGGINPIIIILILVALFLLFPKK